jgi:hypothetical protein
MILAPNMGLGGTMQDSNTWQEVSVALQLKIRSDNLGISGRGV